MQILGKHRHIATQPQEPCTGAVQERARSGGETGVKPTALQIQGDGGKFPLHGIAHLAALTAALALFRVFRRNAALTPRAGIPFCTRMIISFCIFCIPLLDRFPGRQPIVEIVGASAI